MTNNTRPDTLVFDPGAAMELEAEIYQFVTDNSHACGWQNRQEVKFGIIEYLLQQRGLTAYATSHGLTY